MRKGVYDEAGRQFLCMEALLSWLMLIYIYIRQYTHLDVHCTVSCLEVIS